MKNLYLPVLVSCAALLILSATTAQPVEAASHPQQQNEVYVIASKEAQTPNDYADDSLITAAVKTNLLEEKGISSLQISVTTKDGVVTLSGKTDKAAQIVLAEHVAKLTNGVKRVVNTLQVKNEDPQSVGEYIDDAVITTAVKTNILEEKGLSSMQISVTTKDGVVTLTGKTNTAAHSQLAERVAKLTDGVKRVVNDLKISK